ncbi:MAG TPA: AMP-binding protein [Candidatus Dormibacteraeota bacterium]|nr:AMP-binding protein [Candidatus Dormibacteraeota bacterium]
MAQTATANSYWNVPERFNFARDVIDALAREDRLGLVFLDKAGHERRYSFPEIARESKRYAAALRDQGIGKGEKVLVVIPKRPEWLFSMLALLRIGAVAVPSSEQLRAKDLLFRANHGEATAAISYFAQAGEFDAMREGAASLRAFLMLGGERPGWTALEPLAAAAGEGWAGTETLANDPAYLVYTSGTTKDPKGVLHVQAYTYAKRSQAQLWLDAKPQDLVWCTAGTGWAKSLWNVLLGPWSCGSAIVLHEGGFDPVERMDLLERLGVSVLCQAPTEYRLEAKLEGLGTRWKLPKLRHAVSAGEPLNPEVIKAFKDAYAMTIYDGYGQTENSLLVANLPGMDVRPGSMGKPTPGHEVEIIDEDGNVCAEGVVGDIGLKDHPPTLFQEYYKNPEETQRSYRGAYYLTGDRATRDADGYLWFVGRADDVISSAGYRIGPFEVESALLTHPAVKESAVVGSPDADRGNLVKAFVVLREGYAGTPELAAELQEHCKRETAPYKYPREIEFVADLPKTSSGKIRRVELRQMELKRKGATQASGFV